MSGRIAIVLGFVSLAACLTGCAKRIALLYPTHIESPKYEPTARLAHIEGQVVVTATIGVEGNVIDAHAVGPPMLVKGAVANLKLWKFQNPRKDQAQQTVIYDYAIQGVAFCIVLPAKVDFDLPERVELSAQPVVTCDPAVTTPNKKR